jgi:hypothetical protein
MAGECLVVMLIPELLQLDEGSGLSRVESLRNTVSVDGMGRAGFESQMCSNAATVTQNGMNQPW